MTLTSATVRVQNDGDGSTTGFTIPFVFWDDDDLLVTHADSSGTETTFVRGTHYTVTGGSGDSGTLTTTSGNTVASGETLTILSALANTQPTGLPLGGEFPSPSVEQQLDQTIRQIQQMVEELDRAIKFAVTSSFTDVAFPELVAGEILRVDSAGTGLETAAESSTTITLPVSIANGGTGAITALLAREALDVQTARSLSLFHHGL